MKDLSKIRAKEVMTMEDKDIIKLYFARNEDAIRLTSEKYGRLCHALSRNILGSEEDAKECVSDAYLAVWNLIPPEEPRSFSAFLTRIVRNISLDRFDYNTAACRNGNADVLLDEIDAFFPDTMQNFTENIGLEEEINRFLSKQTKAARCVFVRRYYFCDSVSDIAERYGMKESAVKSLLYRVRDRLAAHLKKGGFA